MPAMVTRQEFQSKLDEAWREIKRLREIIEGPPHPGLETKVSEFLTEYRTLNDVAAKQHKANTTRLNIIIAGLAAIAAWVMIFHH